MTFEKQIYSLIIIVISILSVSLGFYLERKAKSKKSTPKDRSQKLVEFTQTFTKAAEKFLVFKPDFTNPKADGVYGYFHLKGYDEWNFNKEDMERRFALINGICKTCNKNAATVGYYSKGIMRGFEDHNKWEMPSSSPEILCKNCALEKIYPVLVSNTKNFEVLSSPYGGDGIYISTTTEK